MSNPARVLHHRYVEWQERLANGGMAMVQVVEINSATGIREVIEATHALHRLDEILTNLQAAGVNVSLYRRQYPRWWRGVLAHSAGWHTAIGAENVMTSDDMDSLEGVANFLDGKVLEFSPQMITDLRELLKSVRKALEDDDELSDHMRRYLHRLLQEMQNALDDDAIGLGYDYAGGTERLLVTLRAVAGENTSQAGEWKKLVGRIISHPFTGALAIEASSVAAQLALES